MDESNPKKGKEFCFLFYPGEYLRDTHTMSAKAHVVYDKIMCDHMRDMMIPEDRLRSFTKHLDDDEKSELAYVLEKVDNGFCITWVRDSIMKRQAFTESRRKSRKSADETQVRLYLIRDHVRGLHKIGSSVNPYKRFNELIFTKSNNTLLSSPQEEKNYSLIWYSDPIDRENEGILHDKFNDRRIVGEWFELSKSDIKEIVTTYVGSYVSEKIARTSSRTVKEKVIVKVNNINTKDDEIFEAFRVAYKGTKRGPDVEFEAFKAKHDDWRQAIPLLMPALEKEISWRNRQIIAGVKFIPDWKHLKTWLYQRCWTQELKAVKDGTVIPTEKKEAAKQQTKAEKAGIIFPDFYDEDFAIAYSKSYVDFTQDYWNHLRSKGWIKNGDEWIKQS